MKSGLETIVYTLAKHIRTLEPTLDVLEEFPEHHKQLSLPSLSIVTPGDSDMINLMPTLHSTVANGDMTDATYIVGQYNITLQLDLWTEYKNTNIDWYEKLMDCFDSQFINGDKPQGLSLVLDDYEDAIARYDVVGYNYQDNEENSQRSEWRRTLQVKVTAPRLKTKTVALIEETKISHEITEQEYKDEFEESTPY